MPEAGEGEGRDVMLSEMHVARKMRQCAAVLAEHCVGQVLPTTSHKWPVTTDLKTHCGRR
jgi:hypothetical protein